MKKIIIMPFIFVIALCMTVNAAPPAITLVMPHGHSGPTDGGTLKISGTQATPSFLNPLTINSVGTYDIPWTTNVYDTISSHSTITNPELFYVPANYNYARFSCIVSINTTTNADVDDMLILYHNLNEQTASRYYGFRPAQTTQTYTTTGIMPVSQGDYFKAALYCLGCATAPIQVYPYGSYCNLEVFR